jgi:predicted phosphodiesterase
LTKPPLVFAFASALLVVSSCSDEPASTIAPTDSDAGDDSAIEEKTPCRPSGVSKGPWALGMTRTSIHVRWEACTESAKGGVVVEGLGERPSRVTKFDLTQRYASISKNVPSDLPGAYFMHEATIEGLTPGQCYRYTLAGDGELGGRFCAAQPDGGRVHFLAIADTNPLLGSSTARVLSAVLPSAPDFTIHAGDIQYYDSGLETWAGWFPVMQPLLARGALHAAIGNHESEKEDELALYALRFFGMPDQKTHHETESGGVHLFALDTEESIAPESEQGAWLLARLAEVSKRPGYRASIVFLHRPLATCGDVGQDDSARARYAPVFVQNKALLVVQGHMHGYERFELDGVTYVTTGGGGGRLGDVEENLSRAECASRKAAGAFFHGVLVTVEGSEIRGRTVDDRGAERDSFTIQIP